MAVFWRDSGRPVKFFIVDGRAAWAALLLVVHFSKHTLIAVAATFVFLYVVEVLFKYTIPNAARKLRSVLRGRRRPAVEWWRRRDARAKPKLEIVALAVSVLTFAGVIGWAILR